jgi:hypothetical protein
MLGVINAVDARIDRQVAEKRSGATNSVMP